MRKSLLVAAGLVSTTSALLCVGAAKAQMFNVTASSPGSINFSGTGTANFNNSLGTSNSFQVGSSTNLGVNASTSATPDYKVTSQADLQLASGTTLKQNIGTSGLYNTSTSTVEAATTAAATITNDQASKAMAASGWTGSWQNDGSYDATTKQYSKGTGATAVSWSNQSEYEQKYQAAYNTEYNSKYQTNFNNAYSQTQTKSAASGTDGVISGSFKTVESGTARASGNASDWSKTAETAATAKADAGFETWKTDRTAKGLTATSAEYKASSEYSQAYTSEFNSAYAQASAASNRFSDSSVTVKGIGSGATVAASSMSNFTVDIGAGNGSSGSTGTANGSAGANLATSSFANQSNSSTASAFMQAFGAGGNVSNGTTTQKGTLTTTVTENFKADTPTPAPAN